MRMISSKSTPACSMEERIECKRTTSLKMRLGFKIELTSFLY